MVDWTKPIQVVTPDGAVFPAKMDLGPDVYNEYRVDFSNGECLWFSGGGTAVGLEGYRVENVPEPAPAPPKRGFQKKCRTFTECFLTVEDLHDLIREALNTPNADVDIDAGCDWVRGVTVKWVVGGSEDAE